MPSACRATLLHHKKEPQNRDKILSHIQWESTNSSGQLDVHPPPPSRLTFDCFNSIFFSSSSCASFFALTSAIMFSFSSVLIMYVILPWLFHTLFHLHLVRCRNSPPPFIVSDLPVSPISGFAYTKCSPSITSRCFPKLSLVLSL